MIYCINKTLGCLESTMGEGFGKGGICDKCWEVREAVEDLQTALMEMNDSEPLDGDETEYLAKVFLYELNYANGNLSKDEMLS